MNRGVVTLTNLHSRSTTSLDGPWRAIVDPYDSGYLDLFGAPSRNGYFRDFKPRHPGDRVEYDFDTSMELLVPGDWNTQQPELLYYEGTIWYRRHVDIEAEADGRRFLHFGAANHTTRVFLDGDEIGYHAGGFGPFAVEATDRLATGRHSLVVMVDNRRTTDRIPAERADWWNFGGITRSVDLVDTPSSFLREAWITMDPDGRIVGGVAVDGGTTGPVVVELPELGINEEIAVDGAGTARFDLGVIEVERWSPGRPVLHPVRYSLDGDAIEDAVGFRTVRTDGSTILVNDQPTFLRGISLHAEGPSGGRRAAGPADAETLLGWAVDLGANFVRLGHYQHDEAMVRTADRLGLLAWCEVPVYWGIDFANPATLANGLEQVSELVVRDRSRASVILWSVANETPPSAERQAFLGELADRVRELDPTRLLTAALFTLPSDDVHHHVDDPLGEIVDVIGINQYLGWYYGDRDLIAGTTWSTAFGKPIIFSELGAGAKYGHHGTVDEIWTEEFQAELYRRQLAMIAECADCAGLSPWILKDFRTPVRVLPGIQDGYNRKGLVSEEGERKLAFEVLRSFYASLPAGGPGRAD